MLHGRSLSALGDPRWVSASPHFATYAPLVVLSLLVLSVIQIALGTVWVSKTPPYVTLYVLWLFLSPVRGTCHGVKVMDITVHR
jgi:ABC-type transport system involved in multi-copper enzyme maturation permease subunit